MGVALLVGRPLNDPNLIPSNARTIERMDKAEAFAAVDYLAWRHAEKEPGKWDFSDYRKKADFMNTEGKKYVPFAWVHFPPDWYLNSAAFVPYTNLVTGKTIPQLSIWSPDLARVYDRFYEALANQMGGVINFIRLAMPSEYGEIGYCAGYTGWLIPQPDAGMGYWCGDPHARADYRRDALERYGSLEKVNTAWGTDFATVEAITLPDPALLPDYLESEVSRRRWLDFLDWYNASMENALEALVRIVDKHFHGKEIIASLGYGAERPPYGNDQGRYLKTAARLGISVQSPTNIGHFAPRRVASASEFYGVPYYTEPPGVMTQDQVLDRIFIEISNGTDKWFDYLGNLEAGHAEMEKYAHLLAPASPEIKVAVWHPSDDLSLDPAVPNWSGTTGAIAEHLRDALDYHVIDDRMITDGALGKMDIRCLILAGGKWGNREAWRKVESWVRQGGFLIIGSTDPIRDSISGEALGFHFEESPSLSDPAPANKDEQYLKAGNGGVAMFDDSKMTPPQKAERIALTAEKGQANHQSAYPSTPALDGIYITRRKNELILYNARRNEQSLTFDDGKTVVLPARSIRIYP
jgi:hypothetical protein